MTDTQGRHAKVKEVVARHTDLEQSQNKAQGALLSVLALTQVTELKILLDVGTDRHKLYHFVLALLIGSIAMQIVVGVIVIYIGHLRYQREPDKHTWSRRLALCLVCTHNPPCPCCNRKSRKRSPSYISVPIGVGTQEAKVDTMEMASSTQYIDNESDPGDGCCDWSAGERDHHGDEPEMSSYLQRHQADLEQAKVKLANAVATILRLTNEMDKMEAEGHHKRSPPRNLETEKQLQEIRVDLNIARREKDQADAELALAETRRKQAITMTTEQEDREEVLTFRKIRSWQQVALYLLYFITLTNVFITAIGLSTQA